jgi:FeS assembly SUF system protein
MLERLNSMNQNISQEVNDKIVERLRGIFDPEIPVNIYDLGLVYDISVDENKVAHILMTLTAPNCPVAESLPEEVKMKIAAIEGIEDCEVEITFDPPWDQDMMSESAMLDLGFL